MQKVRTAAALVSLVLLALAGCRGGASTSAQDPGAPDVAVTVSSAAATGFVALTGETVECAVTQPARAGDQIALVVRDAAGGSVSRQATLAVGGAQAVTFSSVSFLTLADGVLRFEASLSRAGALLSAATATATKDAAGPVVALASPSAGAIVSGPGLTLDATASDGAGVARVEFFLEVPGVAQKVGEATVAPFSVSADLLSSALSLSDGAATLTARATDALGNARTSAPVPVSLSVTASRAVAFSVAPTVRRNPNQSAPLAAIASFRTTVPCRARVTIEDGVRTFTAAFADLALLHERTLLGFRPARAHAITIEVEDALGRTTRTAAPLPFTSAPLPPDFPPIDVLVSSPALMEPGIRMLTCTPRGGPGYRNVFVALDEEGEVVWFRQHDAGGDFERTPAGTLVYIEGNFDLVEIDMLGNVLTRWHATGLDPSGPPGSIPVATDTFHHEVSILPSGNLLALSSELRAVTGFPTSETNTAAPSATANVVGDVVVEFRRDGSIVKRWSMLDILDPRRIGYGSLGGFWNGPYGTSTRDWSHGNAVAYDPTDDSYTVSLRHQDAVVKLDRAGGALTWILGTGANWRAPWTSALLAPEPGTEEQYHQHAVKWLPNGNLMLFDNGNFRASPPDPRLPATSNYSRALELRVSATAMTFGEAWAYGGPGDEIFYSPFICDADLLPLTGNVLVTDGGRVVDANGVPQDTNQGHVSARIAEVTHTTPPVKVFEVVIDDTSPAGVSWQVYRSEHYPSLYP